MAATVNIHQLTGAGPTQTSVTSGCSLLGSSDEVSGSSIRITTSASNYSYFGSFILYAACAPDTQLDNVKWYSDGTNSLGTGVDMVVVTASAYVPATGTAGSSGIELVEACHVGMEDSVGSPVWQYTSAAASKLSLSGSILNVTGSFPDQFIVMQVQVEDSAGAGNTTEETITWEYDES